MTDKKTKVSGSSYFSKTVAQRTQGTLQVRLFIFHKVVQRRI